MAIKLKAGQKLVVASHNPGKVREINALLAPFGVDAVSAGELGLPEPEETGATFIANAELKALSAARASGLPALADDSGLEIAALDGAPGIYSARWAGETKDFSLAMCRVEKELELRDAMTPEQRRANFTCALTLATPDGACDTFEGKVFGTLVWPPRGTRGFGYDPIFLPEGGTQTFGEMEPDEKHGQSHRARAFELFREACLDAPR
ncbi:MAG: RdgB/HAM1 family non-canonical purine NTP pyrophosphatase [Alphaproteobacteria bacterium]